MAHRLEPINGAYLEPEEVLRRIADVFCHVDVNYDEGAIHIQQMIEQFIRMKAPQAVVEQHRSLKDLTPRVIVMDELVDNETFLKFFLMPGKEILIGYCSGQHESNSEQLLNKLARTLNYKIVLI